MRFTDLLFMTALLSISPLGWVFWFIFLNGIANIIKSLRSESDSDSDANSKRENPNLKEDK